MGGDSGGGTADTADKKELASIAAEQWTDYQTRYKPAENVAIKKALDREQISNQLRGTTSADFYQRFGEGNKEVVAGLAKRGIAGSPAMASGVQGYGLDRSYATGQGLAGVETLATQQRLANAQQLVNLGQGQASEASGGIAESAAASQRQAIMDARAAAAARGATQQLVGTGIGLGTGVALENYKAPTTTVTPSTYSAPVVAGRGGY